MSPRQRQLHYTGRIRLVVEVGGQICANETKCEQSFHSQRMCPSTPRRTVLRRASGDMCWRMEHIRLASISAMGAFTMPEGRPVLTVDGPARDARVGRLSLESPGVPGSPIPVRRQAEPPDERLSHHGHRLVKVFQMPQPLPTRRSQSLSTHRYSPCAP